MEISVCAKIFVGKVAAPYREGAPCAQFLKKNNLTVYQQLFSNIVIPSFRVVKRGRNFFGTASFITKLKNSLHHFWSDPFASDHFTE